MASTYLSKTFSSSPTSAKIFTISCWIKKSSNGSDNCIYGKDGSTDSASQIYFNTSDQLRFFDNTSGTDMDLLTNRLFRDVSAWYHIVWSVDSTQGTASNRVKLYVNGVQETSFATSNYPDNNASFVSTDNGKDTFVGVTENTSGTKFGYLNGSLAHYHFIDGTAYDADTFGETDATTGIWKPKTAPSVTYGTNGFFLKFENSGAFGTDSSGNGNNFTVNGTMTQTIDTPSNVFATMNAIDNSSVTLSNGNLTCSCASPSGIRSTLAVSAGKYYAEVKYTNTASFCGIVAMEQLVTSQSTSSATLFGGSSGQPELFLNGSAQSDYNSAGTLSAGDIIQIALDKDNNNVYFSTDGSWFGGTDWTESSPTTAHALSSGSSYVHGFRASTGSGTSANSWNFGNGYFGTTAVSSAENPDDGIGIFEYSVPTGYRALCTKSINTEEYS